MLKLIAIVGTNAEFSFNRFLCQYIAKRYGDKFNIEVCEINDLPLFSIDDYPNEAVQNFRKKLRLADGVIIATPEYDHAIPAALKSAMEWTGKHSLGSGNDVMRLKPTMVVGTSYGVQGASRAQEDMREILLSSDEGALVLPANEILIGYAATNFDKQSHDLINKTIIKQLDVAMDNFYQFINQWNK